jgi:hypothetical protein
MSLESQGDGLERREQSVATGSRVTTTVVMW